VDGAGAVESAAARALSGARPRSPHAASAPKASAVSP
jgi:hypothetical protein